MYFELQCELDKIDGIRKNWTYFAMKRQAAIDSVPVHQRDEGIDMECDTMDVAQLVYQRK